MSKHLYVHPFFFLLPLILWLTACGAPNPTEEAPATPLNTSPGQLPVQLIVYTPKNLIDENLVQAFGEEANISIVQRNYATDQELLSLLAQPQERISLIVASNYAASRLQEETLLAPLTPANLTNINNVEGRFRNPIYDPNNQYCVAYTYGTIGIGYINGQGLPPTSWGDIFRQASDSPAYGRTTLLNHSREALGAALIHLGYSPNTSNENEINEAKNLIIESANAYASVDSLTYWENLANFQTSLAQGFSRDFLAGQQINAEMNYALPSEGTLLRIYNFCIPRSAPADHKLGAELFINTALQPEWGASSVLSLELPTTLIMDEDLVALDTQLNPLIYPPTEVLNNAQYVYSLGAQEILYTTAWEDVLNAIR
ncbi:MAG: spermidine/putrescine ABC transporter substrate-binding protein [Anaerolineales bacterium]